ncbi:kinase-like domain-containing protein [Emericellopsis atlantica]|uniref:non-specific serine/threonine protein kinase n=1 Tax=Emericellopsis atlantica TaxID=2614577 RepID=A0A9P7ZSX6_9HYPO|nr:kinase-like domain-containing protein [Emericellopsis atlantica]KAG9257753.1 kinase-like domain-containing protein [Emericellopsis atlantica]
MSTEDKYDTLEKIGHGSFGIIRKVRRKADGFIMCRKEISYQRMSQKEREQLHAEFQILSHLRHTNIVAYYHREHLKLSQDLHLYMEYCGNGDLGRVIKDLQHKGQRAPENFVWSVFTQLSLALYRCHYGVNPPEVGTNVLGLTQGTTHGAPKVPAGTMTILHRDLKPENVFLDEDNSVKLGDFGLSKMIKSHDFASTYVGTPFYMSPEICAAEKYTLKSDIWSLGCIIYELCSREPPFNAKTHFQLVQKIKEGKVAPLPEMYSAELNAVIKDCLRVNADRRPDTAQLLNLPVVKLMRKEKEVADYNKKLKAREEAVAKHAKEVEEATANLERERAAMREEIDSALRREWEVKARLEIDRLVQEHIETLNKQFETEVAARAEELARAMAPVAPEEPKTEPPPMASPVGRSLHPQSSLSTAASEDFPSTTDFTDYSLESPDTSKEKEPKKGARTPFGRAQTMFAGAGTPMDVEMASPSPIAIASLSLSPRRAGATKVPAMPEGNIFGAKNSKGANWTMPDEPTIEESDDEEIVPSPTRNIRSSKNPFTARDRPVLTTQKTCPININRLKPQTSTCGLVSKMGQAQISEPAPRSPNRRLSKIPSKANLSGEANAHSALSRKQSQNRKEKTQDAEALGKVAVKNNVRGRTLVELSQARAGGRPVPTGPENSGYLTSPKRRVAGERRDSNGEPVATWDPERDEMPSPFLVRQRRAKA